MDDDTLRQLLDKANAMGVCHGRLQGMMDVAEFVATRVKEGGFALPDLTDYIRGRIDLNDAEHEKLASQGRELAGLP